MAARLVMRSLHGVLKIATTMLRKASLTALMCRVSLWSATEPCCSWDFLLIPGECVIADSGAELLPRVADVPEDLRVDSM